VEDDLLPSGRLEYKDRMAKRSTLEKMDMKFVAETLEGVGRLGKEEA